MIWDFARPDPRAVKIQQLKHPVDGIGYYSRLPVPSLLHLCAESRRISLKWYVPNTTEIFFPTIDRIFVDWSFDFVYIGCTLCQANNGSCSYRSLRERKTIRCEKYAGIQRFVKRCGKVVLEVTSLEQALDELQIHPGCREVFLIQPSQLLPRWGVALSELRKINVQQPQGRSGSLLDYCRNKLVEIETFSDDEDDPPFDSPLEKITWVEYTSRNTKSG